MRTVATVDTSTIVALILPGLLALGVVVAAQLPELLLLLLRPPPPPRLRLRLRLRLWELLLHRLWLSTMHIGRA
jgi:hypothetical protein